MPNEHANPTRSGTPSPPSSLVGKSHQPIEPASGAPPKPLPSSAGNPTTSPHGNGSGLAFSLAAYAPSKPSSSTGTCLPQLAPGCAALTVNETTSFHRFPAIQRQREMIFGEARSAIRRCVVGASPWPLVFWGRPGSGKTCAALCLLDSVGGLTVYRTLGDACDELIQAMNGELTWGEYKASPKAWWEKWETARLSVLDELAIREKTTDHEYNVVKRAIDLRYGKPLVLISNHSPGTIYDERIGSRMQGGTVVKFPDVDLRVSGRQARSPAGAESVIKPSPDGSSSTDSPTSR